MYYIYCGSICDSFLETERELVGQTLDGGQRKAAYSGKKLRLIQYNYSIRKKKKKMMVEKSFVRSVVRDGLSDMLLPQFLTIPSPLPTVGSSPGEQTSEMCSRANCQVCVGWLPWRQIRLLKKMSFSNS